MSQIILQYVLIVILVVGLGYLIYLLKEKNVNIPDDYYGIAATILSGLIDSEATPDVIKKILRIVRDSVEYVELNFKDAGNQDKEDSAFNMAKDALSALNLKSIIGEESIRYLIRLACTLLPATKKV